MSQNAPRHGGRWLQWIITIIFALNVALAGLLVIVNIVTLPVWWHGDPMANVAVWVSVDRLEGPFEVASAVEPVTDAFLTGVKGSLFLDMVSPWYSWLFSMASLGFVLTTLWFFWVLDRLIQSILSGEPFSETNAVRLRLLGLIVVAGSVVVPLVTFAMAWWLEKRVELEGFAISPAFPDWSSSTFILGWLIVILAEAFRRGIALREEQELTV